MRASPALLVAILAGCGLPTSGLGDDPAVDAIDGAADLGVADAAIDAAVDAAARDAADGAVPNDATGMTDAIGATDATDATDVTDAADVLSALDTAEAVPDAADAGPCGAPTGSATSAFAITLPASPASWLDVGALAIPADFTLEAWIQPTNAGDRVVVSKDKSGDSNNQFRLGLTGQKLYFIESDASGNDGGLWKSNAYQLVSPSALPLSTWTHVAVTKSGKAFSLLLNGKVVKSVTTSATLAHTGTQSFRIGAREAADALAGRIDEVRLWNVARAPDQIACDLARSIGTSHPQRASLVGYWPMEEGTGSTAPDALGLHAGAFTGAPTWSLPGAF